MIKCKNVVNFGIIATLDHKCADQDSFMYVYCYFTAESLPGTRQLTTVSFISSEYLNSYSNFLPFHGQKELTYLEREFPFGAGGPR